MKVVRKTGRVLCALGLFALVVAAPLWSSQGEELDPFGIFDKHALQENAQTEPQRQIDWDTLPEAVVAWVEVPGTNIDAPIVQATKAEPNAYLYEDALEQGAYGTPYIDWECSINSQFVVVYGHHMSDGSVFADFANYVDEGYAHEHSKIIVHKRSEKTIEMKPVAVDVVNASYDTLIIDQEADPLDIISDAEFAIDEPKKDNQLFVFCTCSYQAWNDRTLVFASPL